MTIARTAPARASSAAFWSRHRQAYGSKLYLGCNAHFHLRGQNGGRKIADGGRCGTLGRLPENPPGSCAGSGSR
ncbi:hypothetical protein PY32053_01097 [Paracoccus yeei]|uniref:Uncharacterized protein n=1 Tax=Paracoccus yeei TaxID=147645 RepID=A0A386UJ85_9RHOB|nr:hypothetical protein PY32053_01097 [Paracoccus yeei]